MNETGRELHPMPTVPGHNTLHLTPSNSVEVSDIMIVQGMFCSLASNSTVNQYQENKNLNRYSNEQWKF
jgi:hypothetical protein